MKNNSKYFRHYKNKPYRFIGIAKHSEELKDYVIYECLYPNELATLWIRPKDMFFEVAQFQEKTTARFAQVPFEIKQFSTLPLEIEEPLFSLCRKTFTDFDQEKFYNRLKSQKNISIFLFYYEDILAGFKIGYELDKTRYYSWLGAVDEKYRKLGIGLQLTQKQHAWGKSQNYTLIETKSENRYKEMIMLNLKVGFNIVGTETNDRNSTLKVLFQKKLD